MVSSCLLNRSWVVKYETKQREGWTKIEQDSYEGGKKVLYTFLLFFAPFVIVSLLDLLYTRTKNTPKKLIYIQFSCDRYLKIYSVCFTISLLPRLIQLSGFQCEKCISGKPFSKWMAEAEKLKDGRIPA